MMGRIGTVLTLLALLTQAAGGSQATWYGSTNGNAVSGMYYVPNDRQNAQSTEGIRSIPVACDLTITGLRVWTDVAPGAGASWTVRVRIDSVDSNLAASVSTSAISGECGGSDAATRGQLISVRVTASGTPAAGRLYWAIDYEPDTANQVSFGAVFYSGAMSTTTTKYTPPIGYPSQTSLAYCMLPAGTVSDFAVELLTAPGAGTSWQIMLQKNAADTTTVIDIEDANTTGSDDTHDITVVAGDRIALKSVPTNTPAASMAYISWVFTPTDANTYPVCGVNGYNTLSTTDTRYIGLSNMTPIDDEDAIWGRWRAATMTEMGAHIRTAPGTGKNYTVTLRADGNDAVPTFYIADSGLTGSWTGSYSVVAGTAFDLEVVPNSTPTATYMNTYVVLENSGADPEVPEEPEPGLPQTYYLCSSATGGNTGLSLAHAWQDWASANTGLGLLSDKGGGCTLEVYEGTGASYGDVAHNSVLNQTRTGWLTIEAAEANEPLFDSITIYGGGSSDIRDIRVTLKDLTICGDGLYNGPIFASYCRYLQIQNCDISSAGTEVAGSVYSPAYLLSAVGFGGAAYVTISDCNIHHCYAGIYPTFYGTTECNNIRVENCEIHQFAFVGLNLRGFDLDIVNNHVYDPNWLRGPMWLIWGAGRPLTGTFQVGEIVEDTTSGAQMVVLGIEADRIRGYQMNALWFLDGHTVEGQTSGATIANVNYDPVHQDAVQVDQGSSTYRLHFEGNRFDLLHEGGISYVQQCNGIKLSSKRLTGGSINDVNFVNNIVYGLDSWSLMWTGVNNARVWNNLFWGPIMLEVRSIGNPNIITEMYNNIFCAQVPWSYHNHVIHTDSGGVYNRIVAHGNNYWHHAPPAGGPTYPYTLAATERAGLDFNDGTWFVDYGNDGDFTIINGSPAIDAGEPNGAPTTDILGTPRDSMPDIGPYERVWPPEPTPIIRYLPQWRTRK